MRIRNKILLYFLSTVIALVAIAFFVIYLLFSEYREEEFQQHQHDKIQYSIWLIEEYKQESATISYLMDKQDINDFYDEKLLIYDKNKDLIFASLDSLEVAKAEHILSKLSSSTRWIETQEDHYDLIGVYIEKNGQIYYAISKAYDAFGYAKLAYLRNILMAIFIVITMVVLLVSFYLSNKISKPITLLAEGLNKYDLGSDSTKPITVDTTSYELQYLTEHFNELISRTNEAFSFQKHAIQHISHELKTPVSILVSELEKARMIGDTERKNNLIESLIIQAKSLGEIINVLLETAKIEAGQAIQRQPVRMDEILFDLIEELNGVYPHFYFEVNYIPDEIDENKLVVNVNKMLIKQAFQNLLTNCITYSNTSKAEIKIDCTTNNELKIKLLNSGKPVSKAEEKYLFNHFFRGENSRHTTGFGLGLVLTKKIITINAGTITYSNPAEKLNIFEVRFPLS